MNVSYHTQIMLVSDQAAANLLPALDPAMKPQEAVLLVSQKMAHRAQALQVVLQESGIRTHNVPLRDEHDLDALEGAIMDVAAQREGQSIALNVTGGTKLMALAALSVAQAARWPAFYVDVDTDHVVWLDKGREPQALQQQLRLRHYLRGYGYTLEEGVQRPQPNSAWRTLMDDLVINVGSLSEPLAQLNYLAQEARTTLKSTLSKGQLDSRSLDTLLRKFEEKQLLQLKGSTLHFPSEAARAFVNGGWLEHHVYQTVSGLTGTLGIRDKAANLQVTDASGQPNEMDVALLAHNRLFVIECKTARMDNPESAKANDTLYKLAENCSRIGGLGTRGMLVTYRRFHEDRQGKLPELRLAEALNIKVVQADQIRRLAEHITHWVRPQNG